MRFPEFSDPWQQSTLGEVAEINPPTENVLPHKFRYIDLGTVEKGVLLKHNVISKDNAPSRAQRLLKDHDVLFQMVRPYQQNNLYFRPVENIPSVASTGYAQLRSFQSGRFLYYAIHSATFLGEVLNRCTGTNYPAINATDLSSLPLSLPSLDEQRKIAEFLSLIDERIETQRQTIEERKKQKKALICNFFKEIDFSTCPISDFGELKNGYAFRSDTYDCNGSHRIITISNVTGDRYTNMSNHNSVRTLPKDIKPHQILQHNDILISLTGNVGRVSLCSVDGDLLNQRVGVLKVFDSFYKQYVYHLLSSRHFEQSMIDRGQGAAQLNISKTDIENYNIPSPHNKSIIPILSNTLNCFDERIEVEEKLLGKYEEQKQYLLRKMFV